MSEKVNFSKKFLMLMSAAGANQVAVDVFDVVHNNKITDIETLKKTQNGNVSVSALVYTVRKIAETENASPFFHMLLMEKYFPIKMTEFYFDLSHLDSEDINSILNKNIVSLLSSPSTLYIINGLSHEFKYKKIYISYGRNR